MLTYALIFIAGGVAFVVFWRLIVRLLTFAAGLALLAVVVRGVLAIEPRLSEQSHVAPMVAGGFGAFVVGMVFYRVIYNALVDADLRRTIERDRAQANARRI